MKQHTRKKYQREHEYQRDPHGKGEMWVVTWIAMASSRDRPRLLTMEIHVAIHDEKKPGCGSL